MLLPPARIVPCALFVTACALSLAACSSKFEGKFSGSLTEDASLSVVNDSGALQTIEVDQTTEGVEIELSPSDEPRVYDISMPGCDFQAMLFGSRLEVGGSKTCAVEVPPGADWSGELELTGTGRYDGRDLLLEVTGTSADSGIGGSYRWTFRGPKKPAG